MTAARARLYVWLLLGAPTFIWWRESLIWVVIMSYYTILVGELSTDHATRAHKEK